MPVVLKQAPDVCIDSQTWSDDTLNKLLKKDIDFGIGILEWDKRSVFQVSSLPDELNAIELRKDHSVCIMRANHPALNEDWNLDTFLKYKHIQVTTGGIKGWLLQEVLEKKNRSINAIANMSDFRSAMKLCEQSDLLMCYPASSIDKEIETSLVVKPIPLDLKPAAHFLIWHRHLDNDPSHRWLRDIIVNTSLSSPT